ncbi:putative ACT domain-containing protein ACR1-12 [Helianthus debilis subsp. tardiflorus]
MVSWTWLKCNIINAEVWTHNTLVAFIVQVTIDESGLTITELDRLLVTKQMFCNVLKGRNKAWEVNSWSFLVLIHTERWLR